MTTTSSAVKQSGTFLIGGDLPIHRLGYGAMQITGSGVWGEPADRDAAVAVLKRVVDLGIDFIDTADSYGPYVSEQLIADTLHPYAKGLVIATKAGLLRTGPGQWVPCGKPEYLRQEAEMSLRRLKVDRIDLFQLHRIDPKTPALEQFELLRDLQKEGKIRHIGLSEVSVADIEAARKVIPVSTVQNRYNLADRASEEVLAYCEKNNIGFIPWFPLATGNLARPGSHLDAIAHRLKAQPSQVALAWLLKKSPVMLPIPGTSKVKHLEENIAGATLQLDNAMMQELN